MLFAVVARIMRAVRSLLLIAFFCAILFAGCGMPADSGDGPYPGFRPNGTLRGETNLALLLKRYSQGIAQNPPWSGYWWPYSDGGILSSAQNYEAAHGASGAASWEQSHHGPGLPGLKSWFGHCNGWAAAAVLFPEPRAPRIVNGVGFSIADQKALLSEVAMEVNADFFGHRDDSSNPSVMTFQDIFPNQYFAVLTNYLGNGLPLVMDRYTGDQVWNQALAGYQIARVTPQDYLGPSSTSPGVYRLNVTTQVWWLRDDVDGDHLTEAFHFSTGPSYDTRTLRMELWIDAPVEFDSQGNVVKSGKLILARQGEYVVGGAWRTDDLDLLDSHPDYLWAPHSVSASTGFANPNVDVNWLTANFR